MSCMNSQGMPCSENNPQDPISELMAQNLAAHTNPLTGSLPGGFGGVGGAQAGPYATVGAPGQQPGVMPPLNFPQTAQMNQTLPMGMKQPDVTALTPMNQPEPVTVSSVQYLNGALRTQIGKRVTVSFLLGTNTFQDRSGLLLAIGANYLLLLEQETQNMLFCDFYSIKFVRVYS